MPRVVISFDPEHHEYWVEIARPGVEYDPEYQAVMHMKSSHFRNMRRNAVRFNNDRDTLRKFFIEAQMRGREFLAP